MEEAAAKNEVEEKVGRDFPVNDEMRNETLMKKCNDMKTWNKAGFVQKSAVKKILQPIKYKLKMTGNGKCKKVRKGDKKNKNEM